ncbi:MAG: phosphoglycolate phosphatase [Gammaproteobacteria bacterium]|nr:phosphoglycolate phosphatase [Gammaproteobacteria bacterium]
MPPFAAKCVLFDLDGTLVDTAPDLAYAANCVRAEVGLAPLPPSQYRPAASGGARGLLKVALDLDREHPDWPLRRDSFLDHYRRNLSRESRLFAGMTAALIELEARGVRWGVVTNKPGWLSAPLMEELGLARRAACLVSGDSTPNPKPAPDPLLLACEELRLTPADCLYVGDDRRDVVAARAAGMPVAAAAWGYIGVGESPADWGADALIERPEQLTALIA